MSIQLPTYGPEPTPENPVNTPLQVIEKLIGRGKHDKGTDAYVGDLRCLSGINRPSSMEIKALEPRYDEFTTHHRFAVSATIPSRIFGNIRIGFEIESDKAAEIQFALEQVEQGDVALKGRFATLGYPSTATSFFYLVDTIEFDEDVEFGDITVTPRVPS